MNVYTIKGDGDTYTLRCDLCDYAGRTEGYDHYWKARRSVERHYRSKHHRDVVRELIRESMKDATVTWRERESE